MDSHLLSRQAVASLYGDHRTWLHSWLCRRLACPAQAEDLLQDTFMRVLRTGQGVLSVREPRAYLSTVARGLLIDFFRRRALEHAWLEALAALPEPELPSPECQAVMLESLIRIDTLLDGLKPRVREVFLLSQLEGLTYSAIATRLGVSLRTVKSDMATAFDHCFDLVVE